MAIGGNLDGTAEELNRSKLAGIDLIIAKKALKVSAAALQFFDALVGESKAAVMTEL